MPEPNQEQAFDIAIIGGGAAGCMAALTASRNGARVVLIEKNENIGRKLLVTGNSRCNLTNKTLDPNRFHGENPGFVKDIFRQFDQNQTWQFFESLGVVLAEEDQGRIFPRTGQATTVVTALEQAIKSSGAVLKVKTLVKRVEEKGSFQVHLEHAWPVTATRLILTTGGKAGHQFGSSGDGLFWAKNWGHRVTPLFAGLVPIETMETLVREVKGLRLEAQVQAVQDGKVVASHQGDVLFTEYGLSGPAVMGVARHVAPLLEKGKVKIRVDLLQEYSAAELKGVLDKLFSLRSDKSCQECLAGLLPSNLAGVVLKVSKVDAGQKAAKTTESAKKEIVKNIKKLEFAPKKMRPLKEAQVTVGGVDTREITSQMQSKIISGLYLAGEIVDVDADSGGFNLQWAWSSGYVAGLEAAKSLAGK